VEEDVPEHDAAIAVRLRPLPAGLNSASISFAKRCVAGQARQWAARLNRPRPKVATDAEMLQDFEMLPILRDRDL
jgi:hypothetical protein